MLLYVVFVHACVAVFVCVCVRLQSTKWRKSSKTTNKLINSSWALLCWRQGNRAEHILCSLAHTSLQSRERRPRTKSFYWLHGQNQKEYSVFSILVGISSHKRACFTLWNAIIQSVQLHFSLAAGQNVEIFHCNVTSALRPDVTKLEHKSSSNLNVQGA